MRRTGRVATGWVPVPIEASDAVRPAEIGGARAQGASQVMARAVQLLVATAIAMLLLVGAASSAEAAHFRASESHVSVTVSDEVATVEVTTRWLGFTSPVTLTVTPPEGSNFQATSVSTDTTDLGNNQFEVVQVFTIDLEGRPHGMYEFTGGSCCRIGGLSNTASSNYSVEGAFLHNGSNLGTPRFTSVLRSNVAIGYAYEQNLGAVDPDGTAVSYELITDTSSPANGATQIPGMTLTNGTISIPASVTEGWADGSLWVFKVKATDADGEFVTRDILLTARDTDNEPPEVDGVASGQTFYGVPGKRVEYEITASTAEGQTITLEASGLPSWASFATATGNPVTGTLVLDIPAGGSPGPVTINIEATDDDPTFPLTTTVPVTLDVAEPEAPDAPKIDSVTAANRTLVVDFTAPTDDGGSAITNYEYSLDGGATWTPREPASSDTPLLITGLTNGTTYDLQLRAVNAVGHGDASATVQATPASTAVTPPAPGTPAIAPGKATIVIDGQEVEATLTREDSSLRIAGDGFWIELEGTEQDGTPLQLDSEGRMIVRVGGTIHVSGSGFLPGSSVDVWLFSAPRCSGWVGGASCRVGDTCVVMVGSSADRDEGRGCGQVGIVPGGVGDR